MTVFDAYIPKIAEYVENMRATGRQTIVFSAPSSPEELKAGLPINCRGRVIRQMRGRA